MFGLPFISMSQVSLTGTYFQNFNTLATSGTSSALPTGWLLSETGSGSNTLYTADAGGTNNADTYSYGTGTSSERAFGSLDHPSFTPIIGACFTNNTGAALGRLIISYTGEQWRLGSSGRQDSLNFQYSLNATSLTTGTWTDFNQIDFAAPITSGTVGALDGNNAANRVSLFGSFPVNIPNGSTFCLRWSSVNVSGNDDGLAIDDFMIGSYFLPVKFGSFKATEVSNGIRLDWSNQTESNIAQYMIERSVNGVDFFVIGTITPLLNNGSEARYQYLDASPINQINFYRIRAVETDGKYQYSIIMRVDTRDVGPNLSLYPNPVKNGILTMQMTNVASGNYTVKIYNIEGQLLASKKINHPGGSFSELIDLPVSIKAGFYYLKVTGAEMNYQKAFIVQ